MRGKLVSPSLFGVLEVEPAIGRSFRPEEEEQGRSRVVILSDGFWKQQLGGDPSVLGRTLTIMDAPYHHRRRHAGRLPRRDGGARAALCTAARSIPIGPTISFT